MTQEERDNLLLDLKKGQEERDNLLLDLKRGQDKLLNRVDNLEKGQDKLFNGQKEIKKDLENLSQTVARMEVDHGDKLEILLDVVTSYPQKFDSIEKEFDNHENRLNKHADEIYYLNSKVQAF